MLTSLLKHPALYSERVLSFRESCPWKKNEIYHLEQSKKLDVGLGKKTKILMKAYLKVLLFLYVNNILCLGLFKKLKKGRKKLPRIRIGLGTCWNSRPITSPFEAILVKNPSKKQFQWDSSVHVVEFVVSHVSHVGFSWDFICLFVIWGIIL